VFEVVCLAMSMAMFAGPEPPKLPIEPEAPTAAAPHEPSSAKRDDNKDDKKGEVKGKGGAEKPGEKTPEKAAVKPGEKAGDKKTAEKPGEKTAEKTAEKTGEKGPEKPAAKTGEKPDSEKPGEKSVEKPGEKSAAGEKIEEKGGEKTGEKPAGEKPAAKPAEASARPRRSKERAERGPTTTPPSLTTNALRGEMRQGAGGGEGAQTSERARLEQLATDINRARDALRADTAKLEQMLKGRPEGGGAMPVGDPVAEGGGGAPLAEKDLQKEQLDAVSKALKGMKPEQAAAIVARMDRLLAAELLRRMKPADAGAVMGQLKPEVAADLATVIATRKQGKENK
jgi:flagellar motility protein MotE (MotC chaperone)